MESSSRLALCQSKRRLDSYQAGPKTKNRIHFTDVADAA